MKRTKKIIVILLCALLILLIGFGVKFIKTPNSVMREKENSIRISGMLASYEYIDREISIEYFYKLDGDSTYSQIVDEIGEPNGEFGSGMTYLYYEIASDLYVGYYFLAARINGMIRLQQLDYVHKRKCLR